MKIGKFLGCGLDGDVYEFENDKVIKFSQSTKKYKLLTKFENHNYDILAKLYDVEIVSSADFSRIQKSNPHMYSYKKRKKFMYYISEKLNKLSEKDEEKIFAITEKTNYCTLKHPDKLFTSLNSLPFILEDCHIENIMKDKFGNYKFIDLHGIDNKPI